MTTPISPEDLEPCENFPEDSKWTCLNADAVSDTCKPCRIRETIDKLVARVEELEGALRAERDRWVKMETGNHRSDYQMRQALAAIDRVLEGTE